MTSPASALHRFDPLSAEEITDAVAAVRAGDRLTEGAWFSTITLDEPPRGVDGSPRQVRLVIVDGPEASVVEALVDVASGEVVRWDRREGVRPALGIHESITTIDALSRHAGFRAALTRRGIEHFRQVQIDPWPDGQLRRPPARTGDASRAASRTTARSRGQRLRPPDRGPARHRRHGAAVRCSRSSTTASCRCPTERGSYYPEDNEPLRDRPAAARDHPARRPELHRRGQPHPLAALVAARVAGPARRPGAARRSATRTATAPGRSCTAPPSARWSCPTATPARARLEERLRRRRVGPRAGWRTR